MTVTVCIEELGPGLVNVAWRVRGCATTGPLDDGASSVTALAVIQPMVYSTILRTTAVGTNDRGETAKALSVPAPWFNCACAVG